MGLGAGNSAKTTDGGGATTGNIGVFLSGGAAGGTDSAAGTYDNCVAVNRGRRGSTERTWYMASRTPRWIATLTTSEVGLNRGAGPVP